MEEKQARLSEIERRLLSQNGDTAAILRQKEKLESELSAIQSRLADKQDKLQLADRQLAGLKEEMDNVRERTEGLKEEAYRYSREVHSKVDSLLKDAMLEEMVNEHRGISAQMSFPERQIFEDSLVQSVAERGTEIMQCATMLFLGMVDDATTFAETHG